MAASDACRILVVDDIDDINTLFRRALRRVRTSRIEVDTEQRPSDALVRLRNHAYDLVVSDFRMRERLHGIDLLRDARRCQPQARRILMTGYDEVPAPLDDILDARVDGYLRKPFAESALADIVLDVLTPDSPGLRALRADARATEAAAMAAETARAHRARDGER